ncbi:PH domain-containing protein [Streptomyces sp. NPDC047108]|uniref:PH domain-containing protein n=1 Tax=Streptomyces sp. NPDC047108 TaxID=3155025 RepID=UPI0033DF6C77
MTSPDHAATPEPAPRQEEPQYADRIYRSPAGITGGVLLLALIGWLGIDALVRGEGRTPWLALAAMLLVVPVVVAYTVRPAVFAGSRRLRVRNPLRTITLPWASVEDLRAALTSEVFAGDRKYQLWAIPVSLRGRKKAARQADRIAAQDTYGTEAQSDGRLAPGDQALVELRELADLHGGDKEAQDEPVVRWAYEIIAPCLAGALLLAVLLATG